MLRVYIKQAWQMLRQNKLYSAVYIIGTGLAIGMTMVVAIIYYVKIAPLYPEMNRDRTLIVRNMRIDYPERKGMSASSLSYSFVREHLYTLKSPEVVSAVLRLWDDYPFVELPDERGMLPVKVMYTDHHFWNVFAFRFLHGKPFTEADFQSAIKTAVISSSLAKQVFGTTEAEGQRMILDGNEYRIAGVVSDVSFATPETYAQVWVPFTIRVEDIADHGSGEGLLGPMKVYFLARSSSEMGIVKAETEEIINKINSSQDTYVASLVGQPDPYWQHVFRTGFRIDWKAICVSLGTLLLAMLVIPAVNLAGMVSSRMEKRLPEMGIRKAFGASRRTLLGQILTENFVLTLWGGVLGLLLSYLLIYAGRNWILTLMDSWINMPPEGIGTLITADMLFNPIVFVVALGICFTLNLLSAIIPAYYGLKKEIVYSLANNK